MTTGNILTFSGRFADNAVRTAYGKEILRWRRNGDGIYHKKRQPREAAQRLRRRRRVRQSQALSLSAELIDRASNGYISEIIRRGDMEGKLGATLLLHNVRGTLADRVLLVGLGKERDFRDKRVPQRHPRRRQAAERNRLVRGGRLSDRGKGQAARSRLAGRARGRRRDGGRLPLRPDEKPAGRGAPAVAQADAVGAAALAT